MKIFGWNDTTPLHWLWLLLAGLLAAVWFFLEMPFPNVRQGLLPTGWQSAPAVDTLAALKPGEAGTVTGSAIPGHVVCLVDQDGKVVSDAKVGPDGRFTLAVPAIAGAGTFAYKVLSTADNAGLVRSPAVALPVNVVEAVAAAPPAEPTATPPPPTATAPPPSPTAPPQPTPTTAPTAAPTNTPAPPPATATSAPVGPSIAALSPVLVACDIKELTGAAEANASVEVFDGDTSLGKTKADAAGKWVLALTKCLPTGPRSLTVKTETAASEPAQVFAVAAPVIAQPRNVKPATETALNGTATAGSTVRVTAGDKEVCTVEANASGKWACSLPADLAVDKQQLKVAIIDKSANTVVEGNQVELNFGILLPVTGGK